MSKAPGVELGHDNLETIAGRQGMTLRVWYKHLESHAIPKKLVWVTRGKASLAHAHGLDNTAATQLFKHLETNCIRPMLQFCMRQLCKRRQGTHRRAVENAANFLRVGLNAADEVGVSVAEGAHELLQLRTKLAANADESNLLAPRSGPRFLRSRA